MPSPAPRSSRRPRPVLQVFRLEDRLTPASAVPVGMFPDAVRHAYGFDAIRFNGVVGDGAGQTIAIVNAYDSPTVESDLATFNEAFGTAANKLNARPVSEFFRKVDQRGGTEYPAPSREWSGEIALDVQWAHAVAPMADILLVTADSNAAADIYAAVRFAAAQPGVTVVSNSYGAVEYPASMADDQTFVRPGVTFVVAAGDSGVVETPSSSPYVLSVGGTKLTVLADGTWQAEVGWAFSADGTGGGGGLSRYQPRPGFQDGVASVVGPHRGTPDVAYNADPDAGFAVIDTYGNGAATPWDKVGGTSAGAPQWAALLAIVNQGRALNSLAPLNASSPTEAQEAIYGLKDGYFHDIRTGENATGQKARVGYDLLTGRGTPLADQLAPRLAGILPTPTVNAGVGSAGGVQGGPVTLTARVFGNAIEGTPTGTVRFATVFGGNTIVLGTAALVNGVAVLTTFAVPGVGANAITATYLGDGGGYQPASGTTSVSLAPANNTVTLAAVGPSTYGRSVTLSATVAGRFGGPTPTGTVSFFTGSTPLGTAALVNGVAALTTTALPAGLGQTVYAVYSGGVGYTTGLGSTTADVARAALFVTANATRAYGSANPAFTVTTLGPLFNGDTLASALTGFVASAATATSPVGTYAITPGTLAAANYDLTFLPGTLTVTPALLTVTAGSLTRVYGDATPTLTYTATGLVDGDTLAAVLSGSPATGAGSGVGVYGITQGTLAAADPNYVVQFVGGTVTVTPAPLTLTVADAARTYGQANPVFAVTPSGLVNGDTLSSAVTGAAGTAAVSGSGVGTYAITRGTLSAANYSITFVGGTLTVDKAPLTLTADPLVKTYGAANPVASVTATGLVAGDSVATAVTGSAATAATARSGVGTYAITAGTLAAANYDITFVPDTLTVIPARLALTVAGQHRTYGASVSDLTVTPTGLVNGDTLAAVVTGTYATTATAGSAVGTYPVARGSLAAGPNYVLDFVGHPLTIDPARLTLVADDRSRAYGAANPVLSFAVSGLVNGDTATAVLSGAAGTAAAAGSGVGAYAITRGSLAAANYDLTFVPGTLTVTPAPLTVFADDRSKVYGSAVPALTYTVAGLVNGDAAADVLSGSLVAGVNPWSDVGSYPITRSTLTARGGNYDLTFVPGTLTVTPAPLTVTAADARRGANRPNPSFGYTVSGLADGDPGAFLPGTLSLSTPAGFYSLPGGYPITPGGVTTPNYAVTYVPGTLTVDPVRYTATVTGGGGTTTGITVAREDGTVVFSFPAFEPTFTGGVSVAVADVNGDGVDDVVVGAGSGGGPRVRVYSGATFQVIADFFAYEATFRGGVNVAAADVNGDGYADVVTGAGDQGGPAVRVFSGRDFSLLSSFFAFDSNFRNGVSVAAADVDGDGDVEIVAGAGAGGGPVVKLFDGRTGAERASVMAFDPAYRNGVTVAAGPGYVAAGTGAGAAPRVQVRDGADPLVVRSEFAPYPASYTGGVSVRGVAGGRLLVSPTDPTGPADGLWDPLAGTFLGGVPVA